MTSLKRHKKSIDTGAIELIGRHLLIAELLSDNLEVALPLRDRGIDLIAYNEIDKKTNRFYSAPIQLKVASIKSFSLDKKYANIHDLLLVYIWGAADRGVNSEFYAMSYSQALKIIATMGYEKTKSWRNDGKYSSSQPSKKLISTMQAHRMKRDSWFKLIVS